VFNEFFNNKYWNNKYRFVVIAMLVIYVIAFAFAYVQVANGFLSQEVSPGIKQQMPMEDVNNQQEADTAFYKTSGLVSDVTSIEAVSSGKIWYKRISYKTYRVAYWKCNLVNQSLRDRGRPERWDCLTRFKITKRWFVRTASTSVVSASYKAPASNPEQPLKLNIPGMVRCFNLDGPFSVVVEQDMFLWKVTMSGSYFSEPACDRVQWADVNCVLNRAIFWDVDVKACKAVPGLGITKPFAQTWIFGNWVASIFLRGSPVAIGHCFQTSVNPDTHLEWNFRQGC
jgi:hypothetical protein